MKKFNFMKFFLVCFVFVLSFSKCVLEDPVESVDNDYSISDDTLFKEKTLEEINFARTDPALYAEERLLNNYNNNNNDNGAYQEFINHPSKNALDFDENLNVAATKYAQYLATNNVFGHYENGTPSERAQADGYEYPVGENLAAGTYSYLNAAASAETAAIEFIKMLIIDEGIEGVGHRKNIMSSAYKSIGIGFFRYTNSTYKNYTVHDFGIY